MWSTLNFRDNERLNRAVEEGQDCVITAISCTIVVSVSSLTIFGCALLPTNAAEPADFEAAMATPGAIIVGGSSLGPQIERHTFDLSGLITNLCDLGRPAEPLSAFFFHNRGHAETGANPSIVASVRFDVTYNVTGVGAGVDLVL